MAKFYAFDNIWDVGFRGRDGERLGTVVVFWCLVCVVLCCVLLLWCGIVLFVARCNGLNG